MNNSEELTYSQKKYLFAIYKLWQNGGDIKSTDVAQITGVSKASTAVMMTKLVESGYIEKEYYGKIILTKNGMKAAEDIYSRCSVICRWFKDKLKIDDVQADSDAVSIVSNISDDTAAKFAEFILNDVII